MKLCLLSFFIILCFSIEAQNLQRYIEIKNTKFVYNKSQKLKIELLDNSISSIVLFYKPSTNSDFEKTNMKISGNFAEADLLPQYIDYPMMEFYFEIRFSDGLILNYPGNFADYKLWLTVPVIFNEPENLNVIFLSPMNNEKVKKEELFISISLLRFDKEINPQLSKLYINSIDVSEKCLIVEDLINFYNIHLPESVEPGYNQIKVEFFGYDTNFVEVAYSNFFLIDSSNPKENDNLDYSGNLNISAMNENYNNKGNSVFNLNGNFNGEYNQFNFNGNIYLTTLESFNLQPQNQLGLEIHHEYFSLKLGDFYPFFSPLILNGKRLRGFETKLKYSDFSLRIGYGDLEREIEGELLEILENDQTPLESNIIPLNNNNEPGKFGRIIPGRYQREAFIINPSYHRRNFGFSLYYFHAADIPSSIEFGINPKENLVFGNTLNLSLFDRIVVIESEQAISLTNKDIRSGTLPDSVIRNISTEYEDFNINPEELIRLKNILDNFITVNERLTPINFEKFSSFASENRIKIDLYNNNIIFKYVFFGNEYNSFGNPFMKNDLKGFFIGDRIRLFDNQLYLSGYYERLTDNLSESKIGTTIFNKYDLNFTFLPTNAKISLSGGINYYETTNGLSVNDSLKANLVIHDETYRIYFTSNSSFFLLTNNNLSASVNFGKRNDFSLRSYKSNYISGSFSLRSKISEWLISSFFFSYLSNNLPKNNYQILSISPGFEFRFAEYDFSFRFNGNITFGNFQQNSVNLSFNKKVYKNISVFSTLSYFSTEYSNNYSVKISLQNIF